MEELQCIEWSLRRNRKHEKVEEENDGKETNTKAKTDGV